MGGSVLFVGGRMLGSSELVDILVRDGQVVAIGPHLGDDDGSPATNSATASRSIERVERVELGGRTVMRGLRDAHVHFSQWALARQRLDVSGADSAAGTAALVAERLRATPLDPASTLVGSGFRDGLWPDAPSVSLLDSALRGAGAADAAVVLISSDWHTAWLSSAALERYGVGGHPTGVLTDGAWFAISEAVSTVPAPTLDRWVDAAVAAAAARGVVAVTDYELADNLAVWRRRIAAGTDGLRVAASTWPDYLDRAVVEELATGDVVVGTRGLLTMGPLKVISDGSLNTRTAYCHDPYPGLEGTPGSHGAMAVPPEQLVRLMAKATRHGLACAIHAIGDRANSLVLDAFTATGAHGSIEHAQLLAPDDVARFAALGLVASVQPEHAMDDRDVADRHWAGRTGRAFVFADLVAAGVQLVLGSDAPVSPLDPWLGIASAVHRARDGREPWHPEQAVGLDVALAASTGGRAEVEVGDVADLAILDVDPYEADADALRHMPVSGTLLGGRWTWRTLP